MRCDARPASPPAKEQRDESPASLRGQERFENLLRDKARSHDDDLAPPAENAGELLTFAPFAKRLVEPPPDGAAASPVTAASGFAPTPQELPPATLAAEPFVSATVAALQAAARADAPAAPLGPADGAETTWEVSMNEPLGVPVELRATRVAPSPQAGAAVPWSLHVACPALDRAVLARHASRLDARLRGSRHGEVDVHFDELEHDDDGDA